MSIDTELKELAYELWRDNDRNLTKVERLLKTEHRTPVSRVTLTKWRDEQGWMERAAQAEAKEKLLREGTTVDTLLTDLIHRKESYDGYFKTLPLGRIDNQATYAYAGLLKRIAEMQQLRVGGTSYDKAAVFLENLRWMIGFLKETDPSALAVLADHFEGMTEAFKTECLSA